MLNGLEEKLRNLEASSVQVTENDAYASANGCASVVLTFSEGTKLRAEYWRMIKNGRASLSSFDHNQIYGLSEYINGFVFLGESLQGQFVTEARHDPETGDILLYFTDNIKIQILNFTGYEIWEINFPDGTGEYSNYAK